MMIPGNFFNSGPFVPQGDGYSWTTSLIALNAAADTVMALTFYALPLVMFYFIRRRKDFKYRGRFAGVALFLLACGTAHLLEVWNIWHADYWVSGVIKAVAALASVPVAFLLCRLVPPALAWPPARDELEIKVREQTREIAEAVNKLELATDERQRLESCLRASEERVRLATGATGVGIWEWNVLTNEIRWDAQMFRIYGMMPTPDGLVSYADWSGAVSPEDLPRQEEVLQDTIRRLGSSRREFQIRRRADGVCRHIQTGETICMNARGQAEWLVGTNLDITEREQTEAALRESEARFRATYEQVAVGMALVAPDGRWLRVNQRLCDIVGYRPEELLATNFQAITHPDDLEADLAQVRQMLAGQIQTYDMEKRYLRKNGGLVWINLTVSLVRKPGGEPDYFISVVEDITARKQVEAALRESERQFRRAVEEAPVPILIHDEEDHVLQLSKGWTHYSGYTRADLPTLSDWTEKAYGARIGSEKDRINQLFDLNETAQNGEWTITAKNGAKRIWDFQTTPLGRLSGGRRVLLSLAVDITERKQAEAALRASQAMYHSLVEQMPAGIFRKDADGRFVFVNSSFRRLKCATREQFHGRTALEPGLEDVDLAANGASHHAQIMQTGRPVEVMEKFVRPDGGELFFHVVKSPVFGSDGAIIGSQGMLFDVTARKRAEDEVRRLNAELEGRVAERTAQLEEANQELEAFSYSVSHDLRAPLRTMDGFSKIVLEDYGPQLPAEGRRYLNTICRGAQQMGELIDDLLVFSRLGRMPLNRRSVDMTLLARETFAELQAHENGRQINFQMDDLPECTGDAALLKQIWINLLANALKYTSRRAQAVVSVGSVSSHGDVVYFVRDNGAGFDMKYAGKLFGVFQRLHRADEFAGTGVGLATVLRVIKRHGGRIWAEAVVDQGAAFYFTLK